MNLEKTDHNDGAGQGTMGRRDFLRGWIGAVAAAALGGLGWLVGRRAVTEAAVWQIDPQKCIQCGGCATNCVLSPSAVKCVHAYPMCGYCELCFGYFRPDAGELSEGAENQLCPVGAIRRRFVEEPYYEYTVDEELCIGCGRCVKGCNTFGNGSLMLQVRHDRCVDCNECSIARACPADAFVRVPARQPYLLRGVTLERIAKNDGAWRAQGGKVSWTE